MYGNMHFYKLKVISYDISFSAINFLNLSKQWILFQDNFLEDLVLQQNVEVLAVIKVRMIEFCFDNQAL